MVRTDRTNPAPDTAGSAARRAGKRVVTTAVRTPHQRSRAGVGSADSHAPGRQSDVCGLIIEGRRRNAVSAATDRRPQVRSLTRTTPSPATFPSVIQATRHEIQSRSGTFDSLTRWTYWRAK